MKAPTRLLAAAMILGASVAPFGGLLAQTVAGATGSTTSGPSPASTPAPTGFDLQVAPASLAPKVVTADGAKKTALGPRRPLAAFSASIQSFRDSLVARARAQIGTRYKMGGTAPEGGFDCSGLVRFVAKAFDISLPRTARQQAKMGVPVPKDLAAMKPGDLLTFGKGSKISHIGIYVGEGRMVHASTTKHEVIETSLVGTRSPLIKQWKGVRRMAAGTSVKLRDSVLAMLDTIH